MASTIELSQKVNFLENEVAMLRSFLVGLVKKDNEGEYKPAFVKKIFKAFAEPADFTFRGKDDFLSAIKNNG